MDSSDDDGSPLGSAITVRSTDEDGDTSDDAFLANEGMENARF